LDASENWAKNPLDSSRVFKIKYKQFLKPLVYELKKNVSTSKATCSILQFESWSSEGLSTREKTEGEKVSRWRFSVMFASNGFLGWFFNGVRFAVTKEGGGVIVGEFHCIGLAPRFSLLRLLSPAAAAAEDSKLKFVKSKQTIYIHYKAHCFSMEYGTESDVP